ncbi:uncharacterized protein LOC125667124 [Ostrea edulis]|uniref:uncharacterized protein LOC125667124 n=1 Tax=Ostrea edulis TaxID=37623 RepID=UPI0024AF9059|nr:uncharacterized protein LOC125667124 [Ostrea edulis]
MGYNPQGITLTIASLIVLVSGHCGVHQTLDVVILYDESSSVSQSYFDEQIQFVVSLADALLLSSSHTNIAGVGVDVIGYYGWGLRDYFTSSAISSKMQNITRGNGNSDLSDGFNVVWNRILSNGTRSGSQAWILVLTDTSTLSDTTSLDAAKAAGVKVGFLSTLSASSYTSYASDSSYIIGGTSWLSFPSLVTSAVEFFCPQYCENFVFYYDLPSSMKVQADTYSNVGYYLTETDPTYNIHCCGAVSTLEYNAATSGTFKFQIWRQYVLVSEVSISAAAGAQTYTFSPKLAVKAGDVVGWYSSGTNPIGIASSCSGDLCTSNIKRAMNMGSVAVGSSYSWANATALPDTVFAIKFTILNSTVPSFSQSSPVYISETLALGSSVTVFTFTDDTGDELIYNDPSSPYFAYNTSSGLISLVAPLPVTNQETPYVFVIEAMDSCFNSATASINITSYAVPPAFNNLPTEVELGDDVTAETLLIVINVTDESAPSIICTETSILPDTQYFRLDDYQNGSAAVYLNADSVLDFDTAEEYKMFITCTGSSSLESVLTIRILDKSVTTPYTVPAWAAGAIAISVGSVGVVIALVCFLIIIILATTDEAEVLPPVEDESAKKEVDDAAQMYKNVDKVQLYREGYGEF